MQKKIKATQRIDDCECIYCGHIFDGNKACNGDMDCSLVAWPKRGKEMKYYYQ